AAMSVILLVRARLVIPRGTGEVPGAGAVPAPLEPAGSRGREPHSPSGSDTESPTPYASIHGSVGAGNRAAVLKLRFAAARTCLRAKPPRPASAATRCAPGGCRSRPAVEQLWRRWRDRAR